MEIKEVYAELVCEVCEVIFPTSKRCFKNRKHICRSCSNRQAQLKRSSIREEEKLQRESLEEKICSKCNVLKKISSFQKVIYKDKSSCVRNICIECQKEKQKINYQKNKNEGNSLSWNKTPETYISKLFYKASQRNKKFDLNKEYLFTLFEIQKGLCAISGEKLTYHKDNLSTNISIDRIDSSKGYIEGNIQLVCAYVNIMKWNKSKEELIYWCEKIISNSSNGN